MVFGKCEYCGKEMSAPCRSQLRRFCSHKCSNRWKWENVRKRAETVTMACFNCGKPVTRDVNDWRFKKGAKKVFCSNECSIEYAKNHLKYKTCQWCGNEFYRKNRNALYCSADCAMMGRRLHRYWQQHDPNITKEEFVSLYSSGEAFVYAGREKDYYKEYNKENKERIAAKRNERLQEDPVAAYSLKIKKLIQAVYARKQKSVEPKLFSILGCQAPEFIAHINSKLRDGMTEENYGEWELDHIIPLSSAKSKEDVERLCHYTNYQPLWRKDNKMKGGVRKP